MTMGTELKPCPFCGSTDVELKNGMMWGYAVHCNECGADVIFHGLLRIDNPDYDYSDEVVRAWNRRTSDDCDKSNCDEDNAGIL